MGSVAMGSEKSYVRHPGEGGINFLLLENENIRILHQDAKEVGEKRLNLFLTFTAIVGTAMISFQEFIVQEMRAWLLSGGALLILLLGLITYRKMLQRRTALVVYRRRMSRIRAWFLQNYPEIAPGLPFNINQDIHMDWGKNRLGSTAFSIAFIDTAIVTLSVIATCAITGGQDSLIWAIPLGGLCGLLTWQLHLYWKNVWMRFGEAMDETALQKLDDLIVRESPDLPSASEKEVETSK
jgi:hypothetical protein